MRTPGDTILNRTLTLYPLMAALLLAGCGGFQKAELVRIQNQRALANKYARGNWMDRRDAVREIVRYVGPQKNDLIIGTLKVAARDAHPAVRIEAIKCLPAVRSEETLALLKQAATVDRDGNVRWHALQSLRLIRDPSAADTYIAGLSSDDWLVREESIRGILDLDESTVRPRLVPAIIRALGDPRSSVVITTLLNLKVRDDALYRAITARLFACSDFDYSMLEAALTALEGYSLDPKTKEKVINLLVHNNYRIRVLALRALKKDRSMKKAGE
jgi:HEAT repeat protein